MKICLTIIFNHRYDDNIKKLKRIYRGRFSEIRFIVPFYDLSDEDVIPVFESSYNFQGYLAQARNDLLKVNANPNPPAKLGRLEEEVSGMLK